MNTKIDTYFIAFKGNNNLQISKIKFSFNKRGFV